MEYSTSSYLISLSKPNPVKNALQVLLLDGLLILEVLPAPLHEHDVDALHVAQCRVLVEDHRLQNRANHLANEALVNEVFDYLENRKVFVDFQVLLKFLIRIEHGDQRLNQLLKKRQGADSERKVERLRNDVFYPAFHLGHQTSDF